MNYSRVQATARRTAVAPLPALGTALALATPRKSIALSSSVARQEQGRKHQGPHDHSLHWQGVGQAA